MKTLGLLPIRDLEEAKASLKLVEKEIDAVDPNALAAKNVDMVSAVSTVLESHPRILKFHDVASAFNLFKLRYMDNLAHYAKATLYLHLANLPATALPPGSEEQVAPLRDKLLLWAEPLAVSGYFNPAAIAQVREGSGLKDSAADLISLSSLYNENWLVIKNFCAVTEQDVINAGNLGMAVFGALTRRDNEVPCNTLRVHKSFTLMDYAYTECRALVTYCRYRQQDFDEIAPSLRRNAGPRNTSNDDTAQPTTVTNTENPAAPAPVLGGNSSPFIQR